LLHFYFMYFLLLVQKKVPKKSTPATIYSRCRPDSYRDDLASVLLLTQLNNSYHRHNPGPKDEKSCFVIDCKPERRCVPFLPSLNLKYLFKRNGTRRYTNKKHQRWTSISEESISAFPMAWQKSLQLEHCKPSGQRLQRSLITRSNLFNLSVR
jgi:hypothetical protein